MGFKAGIVGLPNVGKSTLFNALTKATIAAENYRSHHRPERRCGALPDKRLEVLAAIVKPQNVVPTTMQFVDIAGLVAGASKERAWATSSSPISFVRQTLSHRWCVVSKMTTSCMSPARSTRCPISR